MKRALTAVCTALLLSGCGDDRAELQAWMDETRRNLPPMKETIAEPKRFEPYRYAAAGQPDPFSAGRLAGAEPARARSGAAPDANRRRELLEAFPLDAIRMVGHLQGGRRNLALLQVEGLVHPTGVGQYVGPNHGQVTRVTETTITLRELVQDAAGDWVPRETTLQLQENRK